MNDKDIYNEGEVLSITEGHASTCTCEISQQVQVLHTTVWKILSENKISPYHLQSVQELHAENYPHSKILGEWYLQ